MGSLPESWSMDRLIWEVHRQVTGLPPIPPERWKLWMEAQKNWAFWESRADTPPPERHYEALTAQIRTHPPIPPERWKLWLEAQKRAADTSKGAYDPYFNPEGAFIWEPVPLCIQWRSEISFLQSKGVLSATPQTPQDGPGATEGGKAR